MNDAKSTPFAYIIKSKNPCTPQSKSKSPHFCKLHEIHRPVFQFGPREMETLSLQRIMQNPLNSPTHSANHMKLERFTLIPKNSPLLK